MLGDADGNGVVDAMDYYAVNLVLEPQIASGDYNEDGVVNAADYVIWRNQVESTGSGLVADGNFDLVVDAQDYDIWRTNFGRLIPAFGIEQAGAVPEPSAVLLAVLMGFATCLCRTPR